MQSLEFTLIFLFSVRKPEQEKDFLISRLRGKILLNCPRQSDRVDIIRVHVCIAVCPPRMFLLKSLGYAQMWVILN